MSLRDLSHRLSLIPSLIPAQRATSATGQAVDLRGYDGAAVVACFGAWSDGNHLVTLEESTDGTSWNSADSSFTAVTSAAGTGTVQTIGYRGAARYLRAVLTITGASSGAAASVMVLCGYPGHSKA